MHTWNTIVPAAMYIARMHGPLRLVQNMSNREVTSHTHGLNCRSNIHEGCIRMRRGIWT